MQTLDMVLTKTAMLTPAEYLKLSAEHPERIEYAQMIPPRIGKDDHFGQFQVVYTPGYYEAVSG